MTVAEMIAQLVNAAREIVRLLERQKQKTLAWQELARAAAEPDANRHEIERRRRELDAGVVTDFSAAMEDLREALERLDKPGRCGCKP